MLKLKNAFTLVEIMVTIAIIALLATIAIPNLLRARINANQAHAKAVLKSISTAIETYASINQNYPNDTDDLLDVEPPYLSKNYFSGVHGGYTFNADLSDYTYLITSTPESTSTGLVTYSIATHGVLSESP